MLAGFSGDMLQKALFTYAGRVLISCEMKQKWWSQLFYLDMLIFNVNILLQSACLVGDPVMVNEIVSLFNCTPVVRYNVDAGPCPVYCLIIPGLTAGKVFFCCSPEISRYRNTLIHHSVHP